jgi:hypothetical protein
MKLSQKVGNFHGNLAPFGNPISENIPQKPSMLSGMEP